MKIKNSLVMMSLVFMIVLLVACGQPAASITSTLSTSSSSGMVKEENGVIIHDAKAKVASMSIHITNNLLALGIQPVGSVIGGDVKDFLPHVADQLKGTQKLGVVTDPDMEALLALQPDVIYIDKEYSSKDLAKFEQIAPTIVIDMDQGTWQDQLKEIATHIGLEKKADTFIADYDTKAAQVSTLIHSRLGADAKVMAIRMTPKELRVMSTARPLGPIMFEDLKLQMADGIDKISKDEPYQVISKEVLPDFNADAIFVIISKGNDAQTNFDELEKNPLWLNLKAVKNKHVYVLDGQKWLDYSSLGQQMALEDATQLFSK
ncbi:ABC transporter substrate-binding protein [Paenibacillus sp. PK4536]|uniref:ABC transporter substrate-binding protein n=1 Tax=Paenibacillus sp. PK4536 TaxID=3024576 RepID=UPI00235A2A5C|nr:ABC transporter substrate-binding protein [Paenibacillus sp. PK4536]WIM39522.1 ABC transporter substrate-binding protein [Paenibacillus sp. PK4536]